MTCFSPIQAYKSKSVNPKSGKRPMQFKIAGSFSGERYLLPCGKCIGCRLEHSRRWAVRLMHENKMHKESCFVTLTYDNEHLPEFGNLVPRHLQLFHKRLHNKLLDSRGFGIRYYACGEYGSINKRPHYHSLIFGYNFRDLKKYSESQYGPLFTSKDLDSIWYDFDGSPLGSCKVGSVTFESAAYVARYCVKKVDGPLRDAGHYCVYNADGVVFERMREFGHMSRRPGIGSTYFDKYGSEIIQHDSVIVNGREVPSIRYYDLRIDEKRFNKIMRARARSRKWSEYRPDRMRVKERLLEIRAKQKERKL